MRERLEKLLEGFGHSKPALDHFVMGKQEVKESPDVIQVRPPKNVGNKDHFQRLSYLLQVSAFLAEKLKDKDVDEALSRNYIKNMDSIRKKNQLALSPHVKRLTCKKCQRLLMAGRNMEMEITNTSRKGRTKQSKADVLVYRCKCGTAKRFPIGKDPSYKLHVEESDNLIDV